MPTTTNYIWDEQNYLAETDGTNTIQTVYTNEPEQYGNLVSSRISGTTSFHHFDAIGSTRQLTNGAGTVTDTVTYDAWGNVVSRTGTTAVGLLWIAEVGYYLDRETALVYVRDRLYGPAVGRWTSVDPAAGAGGNFFTYSDNRPILLTDPSGRKTLCSAEFCSRCGPKMNYEGATHLRVSIESGAGGLCHTSAIQILIRENQSIYEDGKFMWCGCPVTYDIIAMLSGGGDMVLGIYNFQTNQFQMPLGRCTVRPTYVMDENNCYDVSWEVRCNLVCDDDWICNVPLK